MMREDQASKYRGQQSMYKSPHPTQVTGRSKKRTWTNSNKLVRTCSLPHRYATVFERALCPGPRVQPGASAAICSTHTRPGWSQRQQPVAAPAAGAPSRQAQPLPALTASVSRWPLVKGRTGASGPVRHRSAWCRSRQECAGGCEGRSWAEDSLQHCGSAAPSRCLLPFACTEASVS